LYCSWFWFKLEINLSESLFLAAGPGPDPDGQAMLPASYYIWMWYLPSKLLKHWLSDICLVGIRALKSRAISPSTIYSCDCWWYFRAVDPLLLATLGSRRDANSVANALAAASAMWVFVFGQKTLGFVCFFEFLELGFDREEIILQVQLLPLEGEICKVWRYRSWAY